MSRNIDIIKALYRSFKLKDYASFRDLCDEDILWKQNPGFPKGDSYSGADEVIGKVFKSFDDSWEEWAFQIKTYYDAGDSVIVTGVYTGKNISTGKKFTSEAAHIYKLNKGKVVLFQQYADTKLIWDAMH